MTIRHFIISFIMTLTSLVSFADTQIQMEEYGGVYRIPCIVNGAKMKFIFDTGASNVCLSKQMAEYLLDNYYISSKDILGMGSSSVADGRIVDHVKVNIKDIEISGLHLLNVEAVVIEGQNAPLLLGQSAIQKLGTIKLDGNILTIISIDKDEGLTQEQIDKMFSDAETFYNNNAYTSARDIYKTLNEYHLLSDWGKWLLYDCYANCSDFKNALITLVDIVNIDWFIERDYDYYTHRAFQYYYNGFDDEAIKDFEKSMLYKACDFYKSAKYNVWANCLSNKKRYKQAYDKYLEAFVAKADELNVEVSVLADDCSYRLKKGKKSVKDGNADKIFWNIYEARYDSKQISMSELYDWAIFLAYKGNSTAQKWCIDMGIEYNSQYHLNRAIKDLESELSY